VQEIRKEHMGKVTLDLCFILKIQKWIQY